MKKFLFFALSLTTSSAWAQGTAPGDALRGFFPECKGDQVSEIVDYSKSLQNLYNDIKNDPRYKDCSDLRQQLEDSRLARPDQMKALLQNLQSGELVQIKQLENDRQRWESKIAKLAEDADKSEYMEKLQGITSKLSDVRLQYEEKVLQRAAQRPTDMVNQFSDVSRSVTSLVNSKNLNCLSEDRRESVRTNAINLGVKLSGMFVGSSLLAPTQIAGQMLNTLFDLAGQIKVKKSPEELMRTTDVGTGLSCALKSMNKKTCELHRLVELDKDLLTTQGNNCSDCKAEASLSDDIKKKLGELEKARKHRESLTKIMKWSEDANARYGKLRNNSGETINGVPIESVQTTLALRGLIFSDIKRLEEQRQSKSKEISDTSDPELQTLLMKGWVIGYMDSLKLMTETFNEKIRPNAQPLVHKYAEKMLGENANLGADAFLDIIFSDSKKANEVSKKLGKLLSDDKALGINAHFDSHSRNNAIHALTALNELYPWEDAKLKEDPVYQKLKKDPGFQIVSAVRAEIQSKLQPNKGETGKKQWMVTDLRQKVKVLFSDFESNFTSPSSGMTASNDDALSAEFVSDSSVNMAKRYEDFLGYIGQFDADAANGIYTTDEVRKDLSTIWLPTSGEIKGQPIDRRAFAADFFRSYDRRQHVLEKSARFLTSYEKGLVEDLTNKANFPKDMSGQVAIINAINQDAMKSLFEHSDETGHAMLAFSLATASAKGRLPEAKETMLDLNRSFQSKFKSQISDVLKAWTKESKRRGTEGEQADRDNMLRDLCFSLVFDEVKANGCSRFSWKMKNGSTLTYAQFTDKNYSYGDRACLMSENK